MSRNLFSILGSLKLKWSNYLLIGAPIHFGYSYFSQQNRNIEISEKYTFDSNGYTNFMIIDTENNHYKVGNNPWFWKWDSIEDWSKIKKGTKIPILYYGYRVPILGFFPNIIDINNINLMRPNASDSNCSNTGLITAIMCAK